MNWYKADLHIHTVLSPCGDLDSSPTNVIEAGRQAGLHIMAITDHNCMHHGILARKLAEEHGIMVLFGAEVTSREEAHLLCLFDTHVQLGYFQTYIDQHILRIPNKPDTFGYQVIVDADENIVAEIDHLLISAIEQSVEQIQSKVHELGGLFIPAHIDRPSFSIVNQLGMLPPLLKTDALEISGAITPERYLLRHPELQGHTFIQNSDAHHPSRIGSNFTEFLLESLSFDEIRMALHHTEGRTVRIGEKPKAPNTSTKAS
jgi:PHP family Zn ribbon phosphoesterase